MGLDTVELVMVVEETFDVSIPDEEAEKLRTVGDLYYWIAERIGAPGSSICPSSAAFYRLRRVLMRVWKIDRRVIRPATATSELVPLDGRRRAWAALEQELSWRLPNLRRPLWLSMVCWSILAGLWPITFLACFVNGLPASLFTSLVISECIVWVLLLWPVAELTRPLAVHLPPSCVTVRGLVDASVRSNYGIIGKQATGSYPQGEVWDRLRQIVAEQAGIPIEKVTEELDFVRDLA
jgi:acyl carrier protein